MLKGFYRVGNLKVELRGYDNITSYAFYLNCPKDQLSAIDKGVLFENEFGNEEERSARLLLGDDPYYISITESALSISKYKSPVGNSYNRIARGYFRVLGSLLTGLRKLCIPKNDITYTEGFGASTDPDMTRMYKIQGITPPDRKHKTTYTAIVEQTGFRVSSIHMGAEDTGYEIYLEDDPECYEKIQKITSTLHRVPLDLEIFDTLKSKDNREETKPSMELLDSLLTWDEIQENHPERNYQWLRDRDYKVITTKEEMIEAIKEMKAHKGIVSFDTETTGLNFTFEGRHGIGDRLVGMVFSIREGQAWYFPVAHKAIPNICTEANEYEVITRYFKPILEKQPILCHNATFDMKVMFRYDIKMNLKEDTMVALRLTLSGENANAPYSLKGATRLYLGRDSYELDDLVANKKWTGHDFSELPLDYVRYYACADTDNTLTLYHWIQDNRIFEKYDIYNAYYKIELPFTRVVAYSEYFGMIIDMDRANELDQQLKQDCIDAEQKIYELAGHEFNISSGKELAEVLFEEMHCPEQGRTSTGAYKTDKKALKSLAGMKDEEGKPKYPIVQYIREFKDATKLISTFTSKLTGESTKSTDNISPTGVISSSVQQFLATSRVSVNKPNYQSFSDTVKRYIIPRRGYYMIDADYSSVEYRITASMSGQENLIEAFFDADTDYHKLKASIMYQIPYEEVTPEMRRQAKSFNFGIPYGMGIKALSTLLFGESDPVSVAKAQKLYELYFVGQEKVRDFFNNAREQGVLFGKSRTYFGGYRYYDKTKENDEKIRRESGNHCIQGTAANIYKMAMSDLYDKILKNDWWGKVLISGFIHDECLLEASCDINPAIVMKALRDSMMMKIEGWCPLYTGMGCGANWDDAKHIEIPTQVQEDLLGKYGETGFDWWNGDPKLLYKKMEEAIYDYKRDRVINYLKDPENHGKALKSVENDFAHEIIGIVNKGKYSKGVVNFDLQPEHDVLKNLENFCKMFGSEDLFKEAGIVKTEAKAVEAENIDVDLSNVKPSEFEDMDFDSQEGYLKEAVEAWGLMKAQGQERVYVNANNKIFFNLVKKSLETEGVYEVWIIADQFDKPRKTKYYISAREYTSLQQAYIANFGEE